MNYDMIKLVGNALHSDMCGNDVPCIGFCNWTYVAGIFIIIYILSNIILQVTGNPKKKTLQHQHLLIQDVW